MRDSGLVEAAGVELFHTSWILQLADSMKGMKCQKCHNAGFIVRVSYTDSLPVARTVESSEPPIVDLQPLPAHR